MENRDRREPEKVYVESSDSGAMGWAVAFIVLVMAIGFGYIAYTNQQTVNQHRVEEALMDIKDGKRVAEVPGKVEVEVPEVKIPEVKMPEVKIPDISVDTNSGEPEETTQTEAPAESQ